jgi:hypothetical protein
MDKGFGKVLVLRMQEAPQRRPMPRALKRITMSLATIITVAVLCLGFIKLKEHSKSARINELLSEFVQVSDDFTRPKHYIHRNFHKKNPTEKSKYFVYLLGSYSNGYSNLPSIPDGKDTSVKYKVFINLNDNLFILDPNYYPIEIPKSLNELLECAEKADGLDNLKLLCRIKKNGYPCEITEGDFELTGDELDAFLKTIELTMLFRETAK